MSGLLEIPAEILTAQDSAVVLRAPHGRARMDFLAQCSRTAAYQGTSSYLLDCRRDNGGPWSGAKQLIGALVDQAAREKPELLRRHAYELSAVLPLRRHDLPVDHRNLTESVPANEKVRNYPLDRAYRMVHGLVDFVTALWGPVAESPTLLVCDHYDRAGCLAQRFFRELLRRRGRSLRLGLVVAVDADGAAVTDALVEALGETKVCRLEVEVAPGPDDAEPPARAAERAHGLEVGLGDDLDAKEEHYPALIRLWRAAGDEAKALHWEVFALGVCNHRGFYEDALFYAETLSGTLDSLSGDDEERRWNLVGNLFNSFIAVGEVQRARKVIEEEAFAKITEPALRGRIFYVMAMLFVRHLPKEEQDLDKAERFLLEALEILETVHLPEHERHFQSVFASNGLALVRHRQGRSHEAIRLCQEGYQRLEENLRPDQHRLHRSVLLYNTAQVYVGLGDLEQAIRYYDQTLEMDPNYSEYHNERGAARLRLGDWEGALSDLQRAIELSPPYPEVWANLGQCLRSMGRMEEAARAYSQALDLAPHHLLSLVGRAQAREACGDLAGALEDYSRAIGLDGGDALLWANRATLRYELGDLESSLADLDQAISLGPEQGDLYLNRSVALIDLGRSAEARRDLETYLSFSPEGADRQHALQQLAALGEARAAGA